MIRPLLNSLLLVGMLGGTAALGQDVPQPARPEQEHQWLQQLVGTWETHGKIEAAPGQTAFECHGTESTRSIGGLWIVAEGKASPMGMPVHSMFTLGYDPATKKFVGTWVDSILPHMWRYEGTLDESGKVLTLLTEGPSFTSPGETAKYKEVLEIKDQDHKTFTSHMQVNGAWVKFVSMDAKRVK